jgi:hypothetical protein
MAMRCAERPGMFTMFFAPGECILVVENVLSNGWGGVGKRGM